MRRQVPFFLALLLFLGFGLGARAEVAYGRLQDAAREPANWLTYSGTYASQRYSALDQITPANVKNLELKWIYQGAVQGGWESSPLAADGVMYLTQRPNDVVALDARTGKVFWIFHYALDATQIACCGANNRGLALLGDTLFLGTLDAHLVAIDAKSGRPIWTTRVADNKSGYSITLAPLVIKDKVLVGVAGGEYGIRGFIAAYDVRTGKEAWRFNTVPAPGEPGSETWGQCALAAKGFCDPDAWIHGGGSIWVTGSYDPQLNLTYWGVGNPGPDYNPDQRPGDNLYTDSVVALDPDTGKLKWHFQFTPHDRFDYDSVEVPVLADITWKGAPLKALLWGNRNGYFYVLDRQTGRFLLGKPFVRLNWASGLDQNGRPVQLPVASGQPVLPGNQGGTNWFSPSFSPGTGLFYLNAWENYSIVIDRTPADYKQGRGFGGGFLRTQQAVEGAPGVVRPGQRGPINDWTESAGNGAVLAIDPATGLTKWRFATTDVSDSGVLTTASGLLFTGGREGYLQALDARDGSFLWKMNLGAQMLNGPITYAVDGKQYVAVISGLSLCIFGLRDELPR